MVRMSKVIAIIARSKIVYYIVYRIQWKQYKTLGGEM